MKYMSFNYIIFIRLEMTEILLREIVMKWDLLPQEEVMNRVRKEVKQRKIIIINKE